MALSRGCGTLFLVMLILLSSYALAAEYAPTIIVTPQFENLQKGNIAEVNILVLNQDAPIPDAVMKTMIVDAENNIVYADIQKMHAMNSEMVKTYPVPFDAITGNYVVKVDISQDDQKISEDSASFTVMDPPTHRNGKALEVLLLIGMVALLGTLMYKRYKHLKREYYY